MCSPRPDMARQAIFLLLTVFLLLPLPACGCQELELALELAQATISWHQRKDAAGLEVIQRHLRLGMLRAEVEGLLGEPDYSPIEGQEYYASRWEERTTDGPPPTLVVDYRNAQGKTTALLHKFWLGAVGE